MAGNSLLDWLRASDDATLAALLRARPDLAVPPPPDLTVLATRAGVRASVNRACEDLDTLALAVLEALAVAGADTEPVAPERIVELLGDQVGAERSAAALGVLRERALIWGNPEVRLVPAALDVLSRYPGGLGRSVEALRDPERLATLLADTSEPERRVLETLAAGPPIGLSREPGSEPVRRLVSRGLLLRVDPDTVELPREVSLAVRGPAPLATLATPEPELSVTPHGAERVDATAGGAVLELLRRADLLVNAWAEEPPPRLRSGGLGIRELRRTAKELDMPVAEAGLLVEVLVAAGLIADSEGAGSAGGGSEWVPTTHVDVWAAGGPEQRWHTLARAWLGLRRLPGLIGRRGPDYSANDRVLGALSDELDRPVASRDRRRVLESLAELPAGHGVDRVEDLAAVLSWRAPRRGGRLRDELVGWTVAEATVLGVVALGALSGPGRALLASPDPAPVLAALRAALPDPVDKVLLQADLTAVAPGPLRTDVAEDMALVADIESAGGATVYRVSERSLLRALDAGRAPAELHELFGNRSATPVPQALTYLIDDVARRHGRLRGGAARSFLRADDEVLLSEVLAHPSASAWELRRIAPTVLVSELPLAQLLDGLRTAGFSPAAEASDGSVLDLRARGRRIPAKPRLTAPRAALPTPNENQLTALVAAIRAGERAAAMRPSPDVPRRTAHLAENGRSAATLELLRDAARRRRSVWIGYVNSLGVASRRIVEPVNVGGGVLEGYDRAHGDLRRFMLHRITSAAVLENPGADGEDAG